MSGRARSHHASTVQQAESHTSPQAEGPSNAAAIEAMQASGPQQEEPGFLDSMFDTIAPYRRLATLAPKSNNVAKQVDNLGHLARGPVTPAFGDAYRQGLSAYNTAAAQNVSQGVNHGMKGMQAQQMARSTHALNQARNAAPTPTKLGETTGKLGKAMAPLAIAGGALNMLEAGNTLSENAAFTDKGADATVQMLEGAGGVAGGALTLAGSAAAPVVGSGAGGLMLGRRGNKKSKDYGIFGQDGSGKDRSASDWVSDRTVETYDDMLQLTDSETVAGVAAGATGLGSLLIGGAVSAGAGVHGLAEDLGSGLGELAFSWGLVD